MHSETHGAFAHVLRGIVIWSDPETASQFFRISKNVNACLSFADLLASVWRHHISKGVGPQRLCEKLMGWKELDPAAGLSSAARKGKLETVAFLHRRGIQVDKWAPLQAVWGDHLEVLKYFLDSSVTMDLEWVVSTAALTWLLFARKSASCNGHSDVVEHLLSAGAGALDDAETRDLVARAIFGTVPTIAKGSSVCC